jgi:predicted transcriptional regulator
MVSGYASDKEDDVLVELRIEGQGYNSDWFEVSGTGSWGYMWHTEGGGLADGLYVISVRAFDGQEYSGSGSVGVILRNNPGQAIPDTDKDGIPDALDAFPLNPFEWEDLDGDGYGDNQEDMFPNNPKEWWDSDHDGIGDNEDEHPYSYDRTPDSMNDPGPFGEDDTFFGLAIPWIIGGMTTISGLLILIFGTEVGFVSFLYTLVFLYSKLSRKKVEDHEVRGLIRGYILANPGDHYSNIKKKLNLNNGTLAYHLKILEEREYIRSRRDGIFKRYYPERMRIDPSTAPLSTQELILNMIIENPGISRREVARKLGISRQVVNYHTKVLVNSGLITYRRENGATIYFVVEES